MGIQLFWSKWRNVYSAYGNVVFHRVIKRSSGWYEVLPNMRKEGYQDWFKDLDKAKQESQRREYGVSLPMDVAWDLDNGKR